MAPSEKTRFSRRSVLSAVGLTGLSSLSGCLAAGASTPLDRSPASTGGGTSSAVSDRPGTGGYADETLRRARETGVAVRNSVVAMSRSPPQTEGTGWYFDAEDLIVTAGHLLGIDQDWTAWQLDGTGLDPTYVNEAWLSGADVGALRASVSGPVLSAGSRDDLEPGQPLVQVGCPGNVGNWVITLGRYLGDTDGEADGFLTSIPSRGGSSGSPTVTLDGEVVGLLSGGESVDSREVYGPNDRVVRSEHVGIDAIVKWIERWTGA